MTGKLRVDQYEKDGEKRTLVKVDASAIGPNLAFCTAEARRDGTGDIAPFLRAVDLEKISDDQLPPALSAIAG